MTDKNIVDLPTTEVIESSDFLHLSQGGVDRKVSADKLLAQISGGSPFQITVKEESSTSRLLTISDRNSYIRCLNSSDTTLTLPLASLAGWVIGDTIITVKVGDGDVTVSPDVGVTVNLPSTGADLTEDVQEGILRYVGTDEWDFLVGTGAGGGGGGTVDSVVAGDGTDVDATDPANPIVSSDFTVDSTVDDYTLGVALGNRWRDLTGSSDIDITCPPESTEDLGDKFVHIISNYNVGGVVTIVAGVGVTVVPPAGGLLTVPYGGTCGIKKSENASDTYIVFGTTTAI